MNKYAFRTAIILLLENNAGVIYGGLTLTLGEKGYEIREPGGMEGYQVTYAAPRHQVGRIVDEFLYLTGVIKWRP